jgi:hypothetical protein
VQMRNESVDCSCDSLNMTGQVKVGRRQHDDPNQITGSSAYSVRRDNHSGL